MTSHVRKRKQSVLGKNRRRKHQHWETTIYYGDGEKFSRVYIDEDRASHFADRQRKSPIVNCTRVRRIA